MRTATHRSTMVATMVVCSAVTLAAIAVPWVRFAYREPGLHIALETTAALVALLKYVKRGPGVAASGPQAA